jgi:hypothetical protein
VNATLLCSREANRIPQSLAERHSHKAGAILAEYSGCQRLRAQEHERMSGDIPPTLPGRKDALSACIATQDALTSGTNRSSHFAD